MKLNMNRLDKLQKTARSRLKQASSLATAVFATLDFFPFFKVIR